MRRILSFVAVLVTVTSLVAAVVAPAGASSTTTTSTTGATIPSGRQVEAESLGLGTFEWKWGATRWSAAKMPIYTSASKPLPQGHFELRVRAAGAGAIRLLVDHAPVAEYVLTDSSTWRDLTTVLNTKLTGGVLSFLSLGDVWVDWVRLAPVAPQLTTRGNRIIGTDGMPITLRGVNKNGLEARSTGWYLHEADVNAIASWGVEIVRIPVSQMFWLPESCHYDPTYPARIDDLVQWVTSRGMYALVDLHTTAGGSTCGTVRNTPAPDELSVTFWQQAAARYASQPLVAFHLFNEPQNITASMWRDGGQLGPARAVGMQELYDTVRATGARNLVFVSGTGWAIDLRPALSHRLQGYGIVLAPHLYNNGYPTVSPHAERLVLGAAAQYPVVITEFGSNTHHVEYNQAVIDWVRANDLSGWISWVWSAGPAGSEPVAGSGFNLLDPPHGQYQPSPAGRVIKSALANG